jgi:hypothetical protein
MFRDVFVLKKAAWHCRLMRYIWGLSHDDFSHICPYFWLSIFNVIVSPVLLPIMFGFRSILPFIGKYTYKFSRWVFVGITETLDDWGQRMDAYTQRQYEIWEQKHLEALRKQRDSPAFKKFVNTQTSALDVLKYVSDVDYTFRKRSKRERKWLKLFKDLHRIDKSAFDNLLKAREDYLNKQNEESESDKLKREMTILARRQKTEDDQLKLQYKAARQEQEEMIEHARKLKIAEEKLAREKKARSKEVLAIERRMMNKRRINKILKVVKPIAVGFVYLMGAIAVLSGTYVLYLFIRVIGKAIGSVPHAKYISLGKVIGNVALVILAIAVFAFIIYLIVNLVKRITLPKINNPFAGIKRPRIRIIINTPEIPIKSKVLIPIWKGFLIPVGKLFPKGLKYTIWPFKQLFKGIALFFKILIQTIKNNCPAIDWKD